MKFIDISWPISENITPYKDNKVVQFIPVRIFSKDNARQSNLVMSAHSGTHIDAPSHFLEKGNNVEKINLDDLYGNAIVLELSDVEEKITKKDLEKEIISKGQIILLKTKNSSLSPTAPFKQHFVYLDKSGAQYLVDRKVKAVGIDYLGIERNQSGHETHITLLENNVVIIEGLRLGHIKEGEYTFCCLPLAIQGLEGAPARAVLIKD